MSLSYFKNFGWEAEVVCVDEKYCDIRKDELLLQSIPADVIIHRVKAFSKKLTSKFGLGSLALRSLYFYQKQVMLLLQAKKYELVYFSTTEFPVCILGNYWKNRFGIPYIIDMQDAWHSHYYQDKPKKDRPKKYWFSYRLHKYLEPLAMKNCAGLISVSPAYLYTLQQRYPRLKQKPAAVIPFGAFAPDFEIAQKNAAKCVPANLFPQKTNIVYVGRGGADLQLSIELIFRSVKEALLTEPEIFGKLHFHFIGTSYAPKVLAKPTIYPIAKKYGIENQVTENTDRIGFYSTLNTLLAADALFLPSSNDPEYSASKIYPYLLAQKPLLAIINPDSPAKTILAEYGAANVYSFEQANPGIIVNFFRKLVGKTLQPESYDPKTFQKYSAKSMTLQQCLLFDKAVRGKLYQYDHLNEIYQP